MASNRIPLVDDGDCDEALEVEGRLVEYPFINAQVKDVTTRVYPRMFEIALDAYTPIATPEPLADDAAAYLVYESPLTSIGGVMVRFERRWARIPGDQVKFSTRSFARPNLHDVNDGTNFGVSFDDGETSHVFSSRKNAGLSTTIPTQVTDREKQTFGPDVFDGTHNLTVSDGVVTTTVSMVSSGSTIAFFLEGFFSTTCTVVISPTECQISMGRDMQVYDVSSDEMELSGSGSQVTIQRRQTNNYADTQDTDVAMDSLRTVLCAGHGATAGNRVALYHDKKIVGTSHVVSVLDTDSYTILLSDMPGKDDVVTQCVFDKDGTRYVNGEKDCTTKVTDKFYLPGVSIGITTGADIPSVPLYRDPIAWLGRIVAAAAYAAIEVSELDSWMGAIVTKQIIEVEMADALETRSPTA